MPSLTQLTRPWIIIPLIIWALFMVNLFTPIDASIPAKIEYSEGALTSKQITSKSGGYTNIWLNGDNSPTYYCDWDCRTSQGFSISQYTGELVKIGWVDTTGDSRKRRTLVTMEYSGTVVIKREQTLSTRINQKNGEQLSRLFMGVVISVLTAGWVYVFMPQKRS